MKKVGKYYKEPKKEDLPNWVLNWMPKYKKDYVPQYSFSNGEDFISFDFYREDDDSYAYKVSSISNTMLLPKLRSAGFINQKAVVSGSYVDVCYCFDVDKKENEQFLKDMQEWAEGTNTREIE